MAKKISLVTTEEVVNGALVTKITQKVTPVVLAQRFDQERRAAAVYCDCKGGCGCDEDDIPDPTEAMNALTFEERREIEGRFGAGSWVHAPSAFPQSSSKEE